MKIIKYEKRKNGKYRVYLDNEDKIDLYEDTIINNKLLYSKEIDNKTIEDINNDNIINDIYNKCLKYIGIRIRSHKEMKEYINRYTNDEIVIENIFTKLLNSGLLNDELFTKAFVHDKYLLTSWGPHKIANELRCHNINENIINSYVYDIKEKAIDARIDKQIQKLKKRNKKNIRNKIYTNLLSLGYSNEAILRNINKYNF